MSADLERWPPPNEPNAFESLCLDLWTDIWGPDSGAQKNGRSGQPQAGVDVFGRCKGKWVGIQCKQKDGLLRSKVTVGELEAELRNALCFEPGLQKFILATTGPRDGKVQKRARNLTEENEAKGLLSIEVWSWEDIWHELYHRSALLKRIQSAYWPHLDRIKDPVLPSSEGMARTQARITLVGVLLVALATILVYRSKTGSSRVVSGNKLHVSTKGSNSPAIGVVQGDVYVQTFASLHVSVGGDTYGLERRQTKAGDDDVVFTRSFSLLRAKGTKFVLGPFQGSKSIDFEFGALKTDGELLVQEIFLGGDALPLKRPPQSKYLMEYDRPIQVRGAAFKIPLTGGRPWLEIGLTKQAMCELYSEFADLRFTIADIQADSLRIQLEVRPPSGFSLAQAPADIPADSQAGFESKTEALSRVGLSYAGSTPTSIDPAKMVQEYRRDAENRIPSAQNALGVCYANGHGVTKDLGEAAKWIELAAQQGLAVAQRNLGLLYRKGEGVRKDNSEACKWYRRAAEQNDADAQNKLAVLYAQGEGVERDEAEAFKWYRRGAELGHPEAQYNVGSCYKDGRGVTQDYAEAIKWWMLAVEKGIAEAANDLGVVFATGRGVTPDRTEAIRWYRRAAEKGNAQSQYNLAQCYAFGEGVPKDDAEAVKWYSSAAQSGHAKAQHSLSVHYALGHGVAQDYKQAVHWCRLAAEQGNAEAQKNLGVAYTNGQGVDQNQFEAAKWYRFAASQENAAAQFNLGMCYSRGEGMTQDLVEAAKWYRLAADRGHAQAKTELGLCYSNGQGVAQDKGQAFKWWLEAAEQGFPAAEFNVGLQIS